MTLLNLTFLSVILTLLIIVAITTYGELFLENEQSQIYEWEKELYEKNENTPLNKVRGKGYTAMAAAILTLPIWLTVISVY